ncbi:MAG: metallophosphoesterase [Thermoflexales bacterium]|nr:metallophosphoesterase [Thermoflexales bacterium]MCS7323782.1 metallophosphoesterase [Thermoflexales bacterium]MCX7939772.1 metallophosphoesterase [Thermoflexales bacterium]MDW8053890.1 metallophosphoesterase [Anaerolineae bacterium]MDW8292431.1 metallophosphoesterase [Anaerolineae bacterium]
MKIAILSDIHGNYPALCAVLDHLEHWRPDFVIVAGDIVNRGPRSRECWQLVQERRAREGWHLLLGNHEEYVLEQAKDEAPLEGPRAEIMRVSRWTLEQLGAESAQALRALPFSLELAMNGHVRWPLRATHGSMLGTRDGIYPFSTPMEICAKAGAPLPAVFCVGHTHQPLVRDLDVVLVVNAGSVGLPFDGDPRASYAQVTWQRDGWHGAIVRLDYNRAQAERDFYETGFLENAGPLARLILRELQLARGQIYSWAQQYEQAVLSGELSLERSVERFLAQ